MMMSFANYGNGVPLTKMVHNSRGQIQVFLSRSYRLIPEEGSFLCREFVAELWNVKHMNGR